MQSEYLGHREMKHPASILWKSTPKKAPSETFLGPIFWNISRTTTANPEKIRT